MRFESLIWTVLALLLAGGVATDDGSLTPLYTEEQLEAKDGGTTIPPTGP